MAFVISGVVKYYTKNDYLIVGDNATDNSGITDPYYSGEVVIQERVDGKEVKEIGYRAFLNCTGITKVTIHAKITNINVNAFCYCTKITYINIPSTVTFIGWGGIALCGNTGSGEFVVGLHATVEFNEGRTQKVYINGYGICGRKTMSVIYPSDLEPLYKPSSQFYLVTSATICAYSVFSFCGRFTTTTDMSQCPPKQYQTPIKVFITCENKFNINIYGVLRLTTIILC